MPRSATPPGTSGTSGPEITLALWHQGAPLPVARTRLTLPDTEQREILTWVRANTLERFGPLRRVPPDLIFDLEFAAASAAPRRKSGLALTNPRLLRWRRDGVQAQTLSDLRESLALPTPDAE